MPSVRDSGAAQLARLSADLKAAGNNDLRKEMLREIRKIARPAIEAVRISARVNLPRAGGLAEEVASSRMTARTTTGTRSAGVRITRPVGAELDRSGRLRHPVYGNRQVWVAQEVPTHWFTRPLEALEPTVQAAMKRVLDDITRRLAQEH